MENTPPDVLQAVRQAGFEVDLGGGDDFEPEDVQEPAVEGYDSEAYAADGYQDVQEAGEPYFEPDPEAVAEEYQAAIIEHVSESLDTLEAQRGRPLTDLEVERITIAGLAQISPEHPSQTSGLQPSRPNTSTRSALPRGRVASRRCPRAVGGTDPRAARPGANQRAGRASRGRGRQSGQTCPPGAYDGAARR